MDDPSEQRDQTSPLPLAGGVGGGPPTPDDTRPPLTPPASGRGTLTNHRAIARQATSAVALRAVSAFAPTPPTHYD